MTGSLRHTIIVFFCVFASCASYKKAAKFAKDNIELEAKLIRCASIKNAARFQITFRNNSSKTVCILTNKIAVQPFKKDGSSLSQFSITESSTIADKEYYHVTAYDSCSFEITEPTFADYKFQKDSGYFYIASYLNAWKRKSDNCSFLLGRLDSDKVYFKICE